LSKNLLLVNDCSDNRHFGSKLVAEAFQMNAKARGYLIRTVKRGAKTEDVDLAWADVVIVNAEGCIHHGNHEGLLDIGARHPAAYLMNGSMTTLSRDFEEELLAFQRVMVRESLTQTELAWSHGMDVDMVPDVIFSLPDRKPHEGSGRSLRFITDSSDRQYRKERTMAATNPQFLGELSQSWSACVGRFHAAVLCAMWGVPFSAFGGNTHKLEGLMLDMGVSDRYFALGDEAIEAVPYVAAPATQEYCQWARRVIKARFDGMLP
jgi:hypothetical protein